MDETLNYYPCLMDFRHLCYLAAYNSSIIYLYRNTQDSIYYIIVFFNGNVKLQQLAMLYDVNNDLICFKLNRSLQRIGPNELRCTYRPAWSDRVVWN